MRSTSPEVCAFGHSQPALQRMSPCSHVLSALFSAETYKESLAKCEVQLKDKDVDCRWCAGHGWQAGLGLILGGSWVADGSWVNIGWVMGGGQVVGGG